MAFTIFAKPVNAPMPKASSTSVKEVTKSTELRERKAADELAERDRQEREQERMANIQKEIADMYASPQFQDMGLGEFTAESANLHKEIMANPDISAEEKPYIANLLTQTTTEERKRRQAKLREETGAIRSNTIVRVAENLGRGIAEGGARMAAGVENFVDDPNTARSAKVLGDPKMMEGAKKHLDEIRSDRTPTRMLPSEQREGIALSQAVFADGRAKADVDFLLRQYSMGDPNIIESLLNDVAGPDGGLNVTGNIAKMTSEQYIDRMKHVIDQERTKYIQVNANRDKWKDRANMLFPEESAYAKDAAKDTAWDSSRGELSVKDYVTTPERLIKELGDVGADILAIAGITYATKGALGPAAGVSPTGARLLSHLLPSSFTAGTQLDSLRGQLHEQVMGLTDAEVLARPWVGRVAAAMREEEPDITDAEIAKRAKYIMSSEAMDDNNLKLMGLAATSYLGNATSATKVLRNKFLPSLAKTPGATQAAGSRLLGLGKATVGNAIIEGGQAFAESATISKAIEDTTGIEQSLSGAYYDSQVGFTIGLLTGGLLHAGGSRGRVEAEADRKNRPEVAAQRAAGKSNDPMTQAKDAVKASQSSHVPLADAFDATVALESAYMEDVTTLRGLKSKRDEAVANGLPQEVLDQIDSDIKYTAAKVNINRPDVEAARAAYAQRHAELTGVESNSSTSVLGRTFGIKVSADAPEATTAKLLGDAVREQELILANIQAELEAVKLGLAENPNDSELTAQRNRLVDEMFAREGMISEGKAELAKIAPAMERSARVEEALETRKDETTGKYVIDDVVQESKAMQNIARLEQEVSAMEAAAKADGTDITTNKQYLDRKAELATAKINAPEQGSWQVSYDGIFGDLDNGREPTVGGTELPNRAGGRAIGYDATLIGGGAPVSVGDSANLKARGTSLGWTQQPRAEGSAYRGDTQAAAWGSESAYRDGAHTIDGARAESGYSLGLGGAQTSGRGLYSVPSVSGATLVRGAYANAHEANLAAAEVLSEVTADPLVEALAGEAALESTKPLMSFGFEQYDGAGKLMVTSGNVSINQMNNWIAEGKGSKQAMEVMRSAIATNSSANVDAAHALMSMVDPTMPTSGVVIPTTIVPVVEAALGRIPVDLRERLIAQVLSMRESGEHSTDPGTLLLSIVIGARHGQFTLADGTLGTTSGFSQTITAAGESIPETTVKGGINSHPDTLSASDTVAYSAISYMTPVKNVGEAAAIADKALVQSRLGVVADMPLPEQVAGLAVKARLFELPASREELVGSLAKLPKAVRGRLLAAAKQDNPEIKTQKDAFAHVATIVDAVRNPDAELSEVSRTSEANLTLYTDWAVSRLIGGEYTAMRTHMTKHLSPQVIAELDALAPKIEQQLASQGIDAVVADAADVLMQFAASEAKGDVFIPADKFVENLYAEATKLDDLGLAEDADALLSMASEIESGAVAPDTFQAGVRARAVSRAVDGNLEASIKGATWGAFADTVSSVRKIQERNNAVAGINNAIDALERGERAPEFTPVEEFKSTDDMLSKMEELPELVNVELKDKDPQKIAKLSEAISTKLLDISDLEDARDAAVLELGADRENVSLRTAVEAADKALDTAHNELNVMEAAVTAERVRSTDPKAVIRATEARAEFTLKKMAELESVVNDELVPGDVQLKARRELKRLSTHYEALVAIQHAAESLDGVERVDASSVDVKGVREKATTIKNNMEAMGKDVAAVKEADTAPAVDGKGVVTLKPIPYKVPPKALDDTNNILSEESRKALTEAPPVETDRTGLAEAEAIVTSEELAVRTLEGKLLTASQGKEPSTAEPVAVMSEAVSGGIVTPHGEQLLGFVDAVGLDAIVTNLDPYLTALGITERNFTRESLGDALAAVYTAHMRAKMGMSTPGDKALGAEATALMLRMETWSLPPNIDYYNQFVAEMPVALLEQLTGATLEARGDMPVAQYLHQYGQVLAHNALGTKVPTEIKVKTTNAMTKLLRTNVFDKITSPIYRGASIFAETSQDKNYLTLRGNVEMFPTEWGINTVQDFVFAIMTNGSGTTGVTFSSAPQRVSNRGKMDVEVTAKVDGKNQTMTPEEYKAKQAAGVEMGTPTVRVSQAIRNIIDVAKKAMLGIFAGVTLMFSIPVMDPVQASQVQSVPKAMTHAELSGPANLAAALAKKDTAGSYVILDESQGTAHIMSRSGDVVRSEPFAIGDTDRGTVRKGSVVITEAPTKVAEVNGDTFSVDGEATTVQRLRTDVSGKGLDLGKLPADYNGLVYVVPPLNSPDAVAPMSVLSGAYPDVKNFSDPMDAGWTNNSIERGEFSVDNALADDVVKINPNEGTVDAGIGAGAAGLSMLPLLAVGGFRSRRNSKRIIAQSAGENPTTGEVAADSEVTYTNDQTGARDLPPAVERIEYAYEKDPYGPYDYDARVGRSAEQDMIPNTNRGTALSHLDNIRVKSKEIFVSEDAPFAHAVARALGANLGDADMTEPMAAYRRGNILKNNLAEELQQNVLDPMDDALGALAIMSDADPYQFSLDVGDYTTALHVAHEGNAAIRRELQADIDRSAHGVDALDKLQGLLGERREGGKTPENTAAIDALMRDPFFSDNAKDYTPRKIAEARGQLESILRKKQKAAERFDYIHMAERNGDPVSESAYNGVRFAAGLTNGDAAKIMKTIEAKYSKEVLMDGVKVLRDANRKVDSFKKERGTYDVEEFNKMQQYYGFEYYVPLYKDTSTDLDAFSSNGTISADIDFVRQGMPRGSFDALNAYASTFTRTKDAASGAAYNDFRQLLPGLSDASLQNPDTSIVLRRTEPGQSVPSHVTGYMSGNDGAKYWWANRNGKVGADKVNSTMLSLQRLPYDPTKGLGRARSFIQAATRIRAKMFTTWNPLFPIRNAINDLLERDFHMATRDFLDADGVAINPKQLMRSYRKYATAGYMGRVTKIGNSSSDAIGIAAHDLKRLGGYVDFSKRIAPNIKAQFEQYTSKFSKTARGRTVRGMRLIDKGMTTWNERYNQIAPAATFLALKDMGMSEQQAADHTRELMNFSVRGKLANSFYGQNIAFLNAAFQSGYQTIKSLSTRRGRVVAAARGAVYYMAVQVLKGIASGMVGEDEENPLDAMSVTEIARGAPLFVGGDGDFIRIPTGFGLPRIMLGAAVIADRISTGRMSPTEAGSELAMLATSELTPFGLGDYAELNVVQQVTAAMAPTIAEPAMQFMMNKTGWGGDITPSGDKWKSAHLDSFTGTEDVYKEIAKEAFDTLGVNAHPETYKFIMGELFQGPFRGINEYLKRQSDYRSAKEWLVEDPSVSAVVTSLGISSLTGKYDGVRKSYYKQSDDLAKEIQKRGLNLSNADLTGDALQQWRAKEMLSKGFTLAQIAQAEAIRSADNKIRAASKTIKAISEARMNGTLSYGAAQLEAAKPLKEIEDAYRNATGKLGVLGRY